ncbi:hypothetical protein [Verrucosispora sp. FIM060022]|uniref:hypothetical protein n=1 Tax=Verrucosispora sp. FIM060022 TaxID=1479020 RepID=UPI000F8633AB|nr:hypothetical protein [Verrucosispora sp. FIM060022]RUL92265.1 hypothetical protein EG812_16560 [Verrucosispora sp. FIM060022]
MTANFLTLAQILNRLTLTARWTLRDHQPGPDGRCPLCRVPDCAVAAAARDVLTTIKQTRWVPPNPPSTPDALSPTPPPRRSWSFGRDK